MRQPDHIRYMRKTQDAPVFRAAAAEIKARRGQLNISQEELAHRAGVHRSFVARLEVAETQPSLAVLFRLADALGADVGEMTSSIARRTRQESNARASSADIGES
jgi:transcriptional regulator with XRE-family HTH domain